MQVPPSSITPPISSPPPSSSSVSSSAPPSSSPSTQSASSASSVAPSSAPTEKPKLWTQDEQGKWVKTGGASSSEQQVAAQKKREDTPTVIDKVRTASEAINPKTLDATASQTKGLMAAIRGNLMPVFDHKKVDKTKIDPSISSAIAASKAKNREAGPDPRMGGDLASMKTELRHKKQELASLEVSAPTPRNAEERRNLSVVKQVLLNDIAHLEARIKSRETPQAAPQKAHDLLRKQAVEPLTTEGQQKSLALKKDQLAKLEAQLPEVLLTKKADALAANLANPKVTKMMGSDQVAKARLELQGMRTEIHRLTAAPSALHTRITELKAEIAKQAHDIEHNITGSMTEVHSTWETVKATHIGGVSSATKLSMVMALDARVGEFKDVSRQIGREMGIAVVFPGEKAPEGPHLKVTICGSTELSSDIDVNTTAVGLSPSQETAFIQRFNAASQAKHGDQTGNKYDINVYNAMNSKFPNVEAEITRGGDAAHPARTKTLSPEAQRLDDRNEAVISYQHMSRFMTPEQFSVYAKAHAAAIAHLPEGTRTELAARLTEGANLSRECEEAVQTKVAALREQYPDKNIKELTMIASNLLYEEHSARAHELTATASTGSDTDKVKADFAMTKAHYFANEAAMTTGVLRATVAKEQLVPGMNKDRKNPDHKDYGKPAVGMIDVSREEYASAGRENVGNVFKEMNHHGQESSAMQLIRAAKYFGRANRNYEDLIAQTGVTLSPRAQEAREFLAHLSAAEGVADKAEQGLLALRKDLLGGTNPLQPLEGESAPAAKQRIGDQIMKDNHLGAYAGPDPDGAKATALQTKMIEAYATLDAELSAHILPSAS